MKAGLERKRGGQSIFKGSEGKSKAQGEIRSSLSSSPTRPVSPLSHVSDGLANIGLIHAFTEGVIQDNRGGIRTKLNSNSVKGKKEATCARALHLSPSSAASPRDKVITPSVGLQASQLSMSTLRGISDSGPTLATTMEIIAKGRSVKIPRVVQGVLLLLDTIWGLMREPRRITLPESPRETEAHTLPQKLMVLLF